MYALRLDSGTVPSSNGSSASHDSAIFPCSNAQARFWFEEQLHPRNPGLNVAVRWELDGNLPDAVLDRAWAYLIDRHASLRTRFDVVDGEPVQIVEPRVAFGVRVIDLRTLPDDERVQAAERLAVDEAKTTFDITIAPLIRVSRLILSDDRSQLLVTAHHTVCDGLSVGILARDMGQACAALIAGEVPALPELPTSYGQFAQAERAWLTTQSFAAETASLRALLRDYKQFELTPDRPRLPVQTANGGIASRLLDRALTKRITELSRRHGCTLFMASLAVLYTVLYRYSGETDIMLGTQVIGRDDTEIEDVVGCFINTVPLRGDLSGDPTFIDVLERTRDVVTESLDLRHFPLERLIEAVNPKRDLSRNALFSLNFIFQRSFVENHSYATFSLVDLPSRSAGALYDLNFFMVERPEGWRLSCEYNADLFDHRTVDDLVGRLERAMQTVTDDPGVRIARLPILTADETRRLIVDENRSDAPYPADQTVVELFARTAALTPQAVAVRCGATTMTYGDLDAASNRLARELIAKIGSAQRVGILLDRSAQLVVTLLAILKSGNAYIPLDPTYPEERLAFIGDTARLAAIVTRSSLAPRASSMGGAVVDVDADAARIADHSADSLGPLAGPRDLAYVIFTSGSTGQPKGVEVEHRSLVNLLWAVAREPGMSPSDVLLGVTTISFDIAGVDMYLPLVTGAQLVIAQEAAVVDGSELLDLMRRCRATIVQATPITWQLLIEAGWNGDPQVRMLTSGEALTRHLADALLERGPELWNMYGPTETTIWSSGLRVGPGRGPVPIGPPIANTQLYVRDANGELVPPGVPGELYIGGDGVARGYFERPDLTRERFVDDPYRPEAGNRLYRTGDLVRRRADGSFEFLGRTDHQIKLRGFRIELGEIEATLLAQPDVHEAVTGLREDANGDLAIWAFVSTDDPRARESEDGWTADLRARLARCLPHYMLPARVIVLAALPRTPNGKIDRNALPQHAPTAGAATVDAPVTPMEIAIASLIAEMLGRESIGRQDDIFALGFHSLLAVRLVSRIKQIYGVHLPLRALFDEPTVAGLAQRVAQPEASAVTETAGAIVNLNPNATGAPFVFLHSDVLANGMYCRRLVPFLGDVPMITVAPHGTAGLPLELTVESQAVDYFHRLRAVLPRGPYRLGGFCSGGLVAYELARLLRAAGEEVDALILVNASAPSKRAFPYIDRLLRHVALDRRLDPRMSESLCYNIARIGEALTEDPATLYAFLRERLGAIFDRAERDARTGMAEFEPFEKQRGKPATENYFAHLAAALTYHPQSYSGEVTLVWGMDQLSMPKDPVSGWRNFAQSVRLAPIQGGHVSPLHDRIEDLGRALGKLLA